jgi:hypothetical protein
MSGSMYAPQGGILDPTMSGSLFSPAGPGGILDPTTAGLLGLAGGFASAAMPSRMPVPFGAALGLAGQGLAQGVQQGQQMQSAALQNQALGLNNQMTQMRMPAYAALGKLMGGNSAPFGLAPPAPQQQPAQGGGGLFSSIGHWLGLGGGQQAQGQPGALPGASSAPPASAPPQSSGGAPYAMSPQALYNRGDMALFLGQDRAASALYGNAQNEAGGTGYAAGTDGTSFAVPGGPADPNQAGRLAYAKSAGEAGGKLTAQEAEDAYKAGLDVSVYGQKAQIDTQQAGPRASAIAGAQAPYQAPIKLTQLGPDGTYHEVQVPLPTWAAQNGGGAPPPPGTMALGDYANRVQQAENNTGNPAAGNPRSSAIGNGQFLSGTFVPLFRQTFPTQAAGMSDADILAQRGNPLIAGLMTQAYARQNAPVLQQAGLPVNSMTLGLAHRFGPAGAVSLLRGWPGNGMTPAGSLLGPDVVKANPELARMPVALLMARTSSQYGSAPVAGLGGGGAPIVGAPQMTPEQTAVSEGYGKQAQGIEEAGAKAPQTMQLLDTLDAAAQQFRTGSTGELRLAGQKALIDGLQAVGITPPAALLDSTAGGEAINKAGGFLASAMTRSLGSREAAAVFNQVKSFNPNIEQTPQGFQIITNSVRQGVQRDIDLRDFQRSWINDPSHKGSIAGMQQAFEATHPIAAYASRVMPMPLPDQSKLQPNVVYRSPAGGVALWDGQQFHSLTGGQ